MLKNRKISRTTKVIGALLIAGLTLGICLFSVKKDLTKYALVRYLQSKGISISFELDTLKANELLVRNIVLADKIKISLVHLKFRGFASFNNLKSAMVTIDSLDVDALLEIQQKFKNDSSSDPLAFSQLNEYCSQAQNSVFKVHLNEITWNELHLPLNFTMSHEVQSPIFSLQYSHKSLKTQKFANFQMGESQSSGQMQVTCSPEKITAALSLFDIVLKDLHVDDQRLPEVRLNFSPSHINITPDNALKAVFSAQMNASIVRDKRVFYVFAKSLSLKHQTFLTHFDVQEGSYSIAGISIKRDKDTLLQNVNGSGTYNISSESLIAFADIADPSQILRLKKIKISREASTGTLSVDFPQASSEIRLNNKLAELSPFWGPLVKSASGSLNIHGGVRLKEENITGPLYVTGKKISVDTEYGRIDNLNFKHDILALPSMKSSPDQKLSVAEMDVGALLKELSVRYQLADKSKVDIDQLEIHYEGAEILTNSFVVYPFAPSVKNFKAKITNLPLEKVLALALKDTVAAEGLLSGHVNLTFYNKVPMIEGQLSTSRPGWIRYRTGNKPAHAMKLSDSPMDILNAYLYDFYYETLSIEFKSDKTHEMIMTLSTYGRNPDYLRGKPLKLRVNLQQNLLASFQAMMLTYDLPNKLKEHLEKVGK